MKRKWFKAVAGLVALVMLVGILPVWAESAVPFNDDFSNYKDTSGIVLPDGWTWNSGSGELGSSIKNDGVVNYKVMSASDAGDNYMQIYVTYPEKHLKLYKDFNGADAVQAPFTLNFKFKPDYGNSGAIDTTVVLMTMGTDGQNLSELAMVQMKGDGKFSAIGGAGGTALSNSEGTEKIAATKNQWYDIAITATPADGDVRLTTYIDGKEYDSRLTSDSAAYKSAKTQLNRLSIGVGSGNVNIREVYLSYDDIKLQQGTDALVLQNESAVLSGDNEASFTFNNPIAAASLAKVKVTDGSGAPVSATVERGNGSHGTVDMRKVKITLDGAEPGAQYTVSFDGITDIYGQTLSGSSATIRTSSIAVKSSITNYAVTETGLQASVRLDSLKSTGSISPAAFVAVYNNDGMLCGLECFKPELVADVPYEADYTFAVPSGTDTSYTIKVICLESFTSLVPVADLAVAEHIGAKLRMPRDFAELPFQLYKTGVRQYKHDATAETMFGVDDAVEVFISADGSNNGDGLTAETAICTGQFLYNVQNGKYGSAGNYILTLLGDVMGNTKDNTFTMDFNIIPIENLYIRSGAPSGHTWIGDLLQEQQWQEAGSAYSTTLPEGKTALYPLSLTNVDEYGMPKVYTKADSAESCQAAGAQGTYFIDGLTVYVNPLEGEDIADISIMTKTRLLQFHNWTNQKVVLENIGFLSGSLDSYKLAPNDGATDAATPGELYIFNGKFYRGTTNALGMYGDYHTYVFDSVAAYASYDGFNYHANNVNNALAVEINCTAYENGRNKVSASDTQSTSNNASTAHESIRMLRVGGRYWNCEGGLAADVNNCYSISIGCEANTVLDTCTGTKSAWVLANSMGSSMPTYAPKDKYVIDCYAGGENLTSGALSLDSSTENSKIYVLDFEVEDGITVCNRPAWMRPLTWDAIFDGTWGAAE